MICLLPVKISKNHHNRTGEVSSMVTNLLLIGMLFIFCLFFTGCGGKSNDAASAIIKDPRGVVQMKAGSDSSWDDAKDGSRLNMGGFLKTGEDGETSLETSDGDVLLFRPETFFEFKTAENLGQQMGGKIQYTISPKGKKEVKITTPHAQTTVLGTIFTIKVQKDATEIGLFRGKIRVRSHTSGEERELDPGQGARITDASMEMISFSLPQGSPIDFNFPTASSGSSLNGSHPEKSGDKKGSGSSLPPTPKEDQNKIDLNESSSPKEASETSSLGEVLKGKP